MKDNNQYIVNIKYNICLQQLKQDDMIQNMNIV